MINPEFDLRDKDFFAMRAAKEEFDELLAFIANLKAGIDRGRHSGEETEMLQILADEFIRNANIYFERGMELIQDSSHINPVQRNVKYARLLDKLRLQALIYADLTRKPTITAFKRRELLTDIISAIAGRLIDDPSTRSNQGRINLRPVFSSSFNYVNVRYVENFGMIGVPPEIAADTSQARHLMVLWHEVAAHALSVARYERYELLKDWSEKLRELLIRSGLWEPYRNLYKNTVRYYLISTKTLPTDLTDSLTNVYDRHVLANRIVDMDWSWQIAWLTEFLEDRFGFMPLAHHDVLFDNALRIMTNALFKRYPKPHIGDRTHPSPLLRILVAKAFHFVSDDSAYNHAVQKFNFGLVGPQEFEQQHIEIAQIVAEFCEREILSRGYLFKSDVDSRECDFIRAILNPNVSKTEFTESMNSFVEMQKVGDSISKVKPTDKLLKEIEATGTIDELFEVQFTFIDPHTGGDRAHVPPPPPPPPPPYE